jgi:hypothetical protein
VERVEPNLQELNMFDFFGDLFDDHHAAEPHVAPDHGSHALGDGPATDHAHGTDAAHGEGARFGSAGRLDTAFYFRDPNDGGHPGGVHAPGHGSNPGHSGGVRFGEWVKWPSGYKYERDPDGHYTGRSGT